MLAGVPLALARNMPGAGPANLLILSMLTPPPTSPPPWLLVTLRSWVQPALRPSSQKQWYLLFTVFFALQGCETQLKCTILRFSGYTIPFGLLWSRSDTAWRKKIHRGRVLHDGRVGFHSGGVFFFFFFFFSVTFKLPFHALPLLSPHPASFRSFTPGASSFKPYHHPRCW